MMHKVILAKYVLLSSGILGSGCMCSSSSNVSARTNLGGCSWIKLIPTTLKRTLVEYFLKEAVAAPRMSPKMLL